MGIAIDKSYNKSKKSDKLSYWSDLYTNARSERSALDTKVARWRDLYKGVAKTLNVSGGVSSRQSKCYKNVVYELIEAQVTNNIPYPKVTARDAENKNLANTIESYLKSEIDRMQFTRDNDVIERSCYVDGTVFLYVDWDNYKSTAVTQGELTVKPYTIDRVYPQAGVTRLKDCEYIFTIDSISVHKIKKMYGVTVDESGVHRGFATLITAHYLNNEGYYSKFGWIENTETVVFDYDSYELRRFRVCKECGVKIPEDKVCPVCNHTHFEYVPEEFETLSEAIIEADTTKPVDEAQMSAQVIAKVGDRIPYYKIKMLPFVTRVNVSNADSIYGLSDAGLLDDTQDALNKTIDKMVKNVLKSGVIVTKHKDVNVPNTDDTIKIVTLKDPKQADAFNVFNVQPPTQQDDILALRLYEWGRESTGITESYQGKRDNTAESGVAKQIAAQQSAGRLESKKIMKDAAYEELYELMFKFHLAYCDETRTFARFTPDGDFIEDKFSRYNFVRLTDYGTFYYNDRFLFGVDNASLLSSNREAMWSETFNNYANGVFGNPADPNSLKLLWSMLKSLGYPMAGQALASINERLQHLPYEVEQAILQDPQILNTVKGLLDGSIKPEQQKQTGATQTT
jgi:hypothetical protein